MPPTLQMRIHHPTLIFPMLAITLALSGCAGYATPGGPAPLDQIKDGSIAGAGTLQPALNLPARLAVARVQAPGYKSQVAEAGDGKRYGFVGGDHSPSAAQLQMLEHWASVDDVDALAPALVPASLDSLESVRFAAAKIQADVLLAYTYDTHFEVDGKPQAPASKLKLGDAPKNASIVSTASALFVDVRTGYVFGRASGSATVGDLGDAWHDAESLDAKRIDAENEAFKAMATQAEQVWARIAGTTP
ncbi:hypothetical protein [Solimonas marina]|uniref:Uncharacterized protein n=1 Tax=Solimonas marina TaxID=2714601 RepID=A0A969WB90_9GAMM|nr:hypothetical protein [Solimonas marina]NKF22984.1 hypothetical protein [Solimonas marina]